MPASGFYDRLQKTVLNCLRSRNPSVTNLLRIQNKVYALFSRWCNGRVLAGETVSKPEKNVSVEIDYR